MKIKYKFLSANPLENSVEVRFYTDELSEECLCGHFIDGVPKRNEDGSIARCRSDYNISLPVPAPTGAALEEYIVAMAPTEWLETLGMFKNGNSHPVFQAVAANAGQEFVPGETAPLDETSVQAAPTTETLEYAKARKKKALANRRYAIEVAGIMVGGVKIRTDRESQAQLTGAHISLQSGLIQSVRWKGSDGTFTSLSAAEVAGVAAAVAQHVQASFDMEQAYCAQIDACTTIADVEAVVLP